MSVFGGGGWGRTDRARRRAATAPDDEFASSVTLEVELGFGFQGRVRRRRFRRGRGATWDRWWGMARRGGEAAVVLPYSRAVLNRQAVLDLKQERRVARSH
jgi:hypothetical protein